MINHTGTIRRLLTYALAVMDEKGKGIPEKSRTLWETDWQDLRLTLVGLVDLLDQIRDESEDDKAHLSHLTFLEFDAWWTDTYIFRLEGLLAQEIDALVSYHWQQLQATVKKHSLRKSTRKKNQNRTHNCR